MKTLQNLLLIAGLSAVLGLRADAAAQPLMPLDWETLQFMDLGALRGRAEAGNLARDRLTLALRQVSSDVADASEQLEKALGSAQPGSDEALLAGMLQCSFTELLGSTLSSAECFARGEVISSIDHPFPGSLAHLHFAIWLSVNGFYKESFQANRTAEQIALPAGYTRFAATAKNAQGVDYLIRGLPVLALKKFQAAIEQVRESNDADNQSMLTMLTSNVASTHLEMGDFESANALLQTLINSEHYDRNNPVNLIDEVILAKASLPLGQPREGLDRLSGVLAAIGPYGVPGVRAYAHSVAGELKIALGETEQGIESFMTAKQYAKRSGDPLRVSKVDVAYADALVGLGRLPEAQVVVEDSINALKPQGSSMILAQALDLRGDIYRAAGQRNEANTAKRQARQMQLEVAGAQHDMDLVLLGNSLELANKANQLAIAQQEVKLSEARARQDRMSRNLLILTALLLGFITYLGLSRHYERKVAKTVQDVNAELEAKVSERTAALEQEMAQRLGAESERQSLAQDLAEGEKLQAIGQLTSGVAHDFNNLMTVVTLSAELMRDNEKIAKSEFVHDVDNILAAAESASDITKSLLAYARKQPLAPQPTDLESFLTDLLPLLERTLGEGMTLDAKGLACMILVDRSQLTTAIINLLLNAKEALQERGTVKLRICESVKTSDSGEEQFWATITVTDDGPGMTPVELRRATQPFYTTKSVGHGTGLGLSMVDGFAKQSGGFLSIDSTKGLGTVVSLNIPRYSTSDAHDDIGAGIANEMLTKGKVIIVDDQSAIRDVLCRLLEQMGLEAVGASSGVEALQLLEEPDQTDLVITDFMMPGEINGQQLAAEIRKRFEDIPVLIMSGYTNSVELDVEFLHKPFSIDDLRAAVGRAIGEQQAA